MTITNPKQITTLAPPARATSDFQKAFQILKDLDEDRRKAILPYLVDSTLPSQAAYVDVDMCLLSSTIELVESLPAYSRLALAASLLNDFIVEAHDASVARSTIMTQTSGRTMTIPLVIARSTWKKVSDRAGAEQKNPQVWLQDVIHRCLNAPLRNGSLVSDASEFELIESL